MEAWRGAMIKQDTLDAIKEYAAADPRSIADDKIIELVDTVQALVPLAKLGICALREAWDQCELDYENIQNVATKFGAIKEVEFNECVHGPHQYAENGDPWFEFSAPELVAELEQKHA